MNATQALAKARKLLGKAAFIRVNDKAPVGDVREQMHTDWLAAKDAQTAAQDALDARRAAVLKADAEYQQLKCDLAAAKERTEGLCGFNRRRVEIGSSGGMFNTIHADGDNFTDALDALAAKRSAQ